MSVNPILHRVHSDWDLGHENLIFTSEHEAEAWVRETLPLCGIEDSFEEAFADGYVYFVPMTIVGKPLYIFE